MENKLSKIVAVLIAVGIFFAGFTVFSLRYAEKIIPESELYTKSEINSALNTASRCSVVVLPNCKITKLYYDEDANIKAGGDKNNITVKCDFEVVFETPVWEKGETRRGWNWEMRKVFGIWIVTGYGFG